MSNFASTNSAPTTESLALYATVSINGAVVPFATCEAIDFNAGPIYPHKAYIKINADFDFIGNVTLNAINYGFTRWSKVDIAIGDEIIFTGFLAFRRDEGGNNSLIWEAWDFKYLLRLIPIRGCVVFDDRDDTLKFISRYIMRMNPEGGKNCTGAEVPGVNGLCPVFTIYEDAGIGFDFSTEDSTLAKFATSSWTPKKALQYLCMLSQLKKGSIPGTSGPEWRALQPSAPLVWNFGTVSFDTDTNQVMSKKLSDTTLQGKTIQYGIEEILKIAGDDFGMSSNCGADSTGASKQNIIFYPRNPDYASSKVSLLCERGGPATDCKSITDFHVEDDSTEVRESAVCEAAPVRVESSWILTGRLKDGNGKPTGPLFQPTDTFIPAWDQFEEAALIKMQLGQTLVPNGPPYALRPVTIPTEENGLSWSDVTYEICDGSNPRPLIFAKTKESLQMIRQILPKPFRCFYIGTQAAYDSGALKGVNNIYENQADYPILKAPRPFLPTQLQPFVTSDGTSLREDFPIRVRVDNGDGTNSHFHDVTANSGMRIEHNGFIFFDGLCDDIPGVNDQLYLGSLINAPDKAVMKAIKCNAAVPLDTRLKGYSEFAAGDVDPQIASFIGGPALIYVDSPEGQKQNMQIKSEPVEISHFPDPSTGTIPSPIAGRFLENDQGAMDLNASRKRNSKQYAIKKSSWTFPTVRTEYQIGQMIEKIQVRGQNGDNPYLINYPIEKIYLRFSAPQETVYGGFLSNSPSGKATRKLPVSQPKTGTGNLPDKKPKKGFNPSTGDYASPSDVPDRPKGNSGTNSANTTPQKGMASDYSKTAAAKLNSAPQKAQTAAKAQPRGSATMNPPAKPIANSIKFGDNSTSYRKDLASKMNTPKEAQAPEPQAQAKKAAPMFGPLTKGAKDYDTD